LKPPEENCTVIRKFTVGDVTLFDSRLPQALKSGISGTVEVKDPEIAASAHLLGPNLKTCSLLNSLIAALAS
jgi:hypothetical protein